MDEIEFEEPTFGICDCCGTTTTTLTRFVTRDGDALAVYYAKFSDGPKHDFISVLVGLGDWGEGSVPAARDAFAFRLWAKEANFNIGLVDPADAPWDTDYLGRILKRDEALRHPLLQEVFDLSDRIVKCDPPIIEFLASAPHTALQ